jgi:hypothetical protein
LGPLATHHNQRNGLHRENIEERKKFGQKKDGKMTFQDSYQDITNVHNFFLGRLGPACKTAVSSR